MTDERLAELGRLAAAIESKDAWGAGRLKGMTWTPEKVGHEAAVWYDDGDMCAEVHSNMGLGYRGDAWAEFFAAAPAAVPELIAEVRRLRAEEEAADRLDPHR